MNQKKSLTEVEPDPRGGWRVTFHMDHVSMRYVLRLVERRHDNGSLELVAVDLGVEHGDDEGVTAPDAHGQPALDALLRGLANRFDAVLRAARAQVEVQLNGDEQVAPTLRTRREMSPEFLAEIVRRHDALKKQGLPPTKTLAEQESVSTATVKHWLRKARGPTKGAS